MVSGIKLCTRSPVSIAGSAQALNEGRVSAHTLLSECAKRMELLRPLNAFITETIDQARCDAAASDARRSKGQALSPLDGIPIAIKDNFCTKSVLTTAGSATLSNFISPYDATVVARLKSAGAVLVGKTNMDEFGMGSYNLFSHYGPCINTWRSQPHHEHSIASNPDTTRSVLHEGVLGARVPGGSSGGSAVAVSGGAAFAALGSDTGGSVRTPAAYCGLAGLKPSYGRLSRWGLIAFTSSLDTPGIIANSVADLSLVFRALDGADSLDSSCVVSPSSPVRT
ncbi:hypothetical protein CYMTET_22760 [Cymbomonas tetramitiformis]|uniref:Amidase domain-containing protein n=1 Tax=Cymbomonas tetramitiformis TaxID=36881 RepID=A0AAE0L1L8_9CHLO|nr:hypothetical protein CYMTET_22760 [Cymbomonas tetramitiformis]